MHDELQQYPTENIVLILSKLPEFLRESMMRSRLQELCAKDSKAREEFIDSILMGLSLADYLEEGNSNLARSNIKAREQRNLDCIYRIYRHLRKGAYFMRKGLL